MRIAIIEDDEITRLELSKLLNTQGYETVLLTDFGNLTDELKQYSIELVLLDINLPYENGYEVCRKIKQVMPVPIIFVTSRDTNADELKSIQVGGIDFITKPYDTLILLEKIFFSLNSAPVLQGFVVFIGILCFVLVNLHFLPTLFCLFRFLPDFLYSLLIFL